MITLIILFWDINTTVNGQKKNYIQWIKDYIILNSYIFFFGGFLLKLEF